MSVEHHYTVLCDYLLIEGESKLAIAGTYANIQVERLPAILPRLCIALAFTANPGDNVSVSILLPSGQSTILMADTIASEPSKNPDKVMLHGFSVRIPGFEITEMGIHYVVLHHDDNIVHKLPFGVHTSEGK